MNTLVDALVADLRARGVQLLAAHRADDVAKTREGWRVTAGESTFDADRLVVALDGPAAVGLLEKSVPELAGLRPASGPLVSLVTLVVDLPQLDGRPRGTGILVAPANPGDQGQSPDARNGEMGLVG